MGRKFFKPKKTDVKLHRAFFAMANEPLADLARDLYAAYGRGWIIIHEDDIGANMAHAEHETGEFPALVHWKYAAVSEIPPEALSPRLRTWGETYDPAWQMLLIFMKAGWTGAAFYRGRLDGKALSDPTAPTDAEVQTIEAAAVSRRPDGPPLRILDQNRRIRL